MWKKEKKQETQEVSPEKEEGRDLYEWAQALVCSVLAVVLLFTFVIRSSAWMGTPWCPPCRTETGCWC